jgi:hypothetical protein
VIQYVNTNSAAPFGYPNVLRITFGNSHWFEPASMATQNLQRDIANMVAAVDAGMFGFIIGSDPTVVDGAQAVTIDFAPTDANANIPVSSVINILTGSLSSPLDLGAVTEITRVEQLDAGNAVGTSGAISRGGVTQTMEEQLAATSFGAALKSIFGTATLGIAVIGVVALFLVFAPEIKGALGVARSRTAG